MHPRGHELSPKQPLLHITASLFMRETSHISTLSHSLSMQWSDARRAGRPALPSSARARRGGKLQDKSHCVAASACRHTVCRPAASWRRRMQCCCARASYRPIAAKAKKRREHNAWESASVCSSYNSGWRHALILAVLPVQKRHD